jgi:hypothetical protein
MQSVLITTNVVNSNPTLVKVYSIYYVIKFVSDLQWVSLVSSTNKTDTHNIIEIFYGRKCQKLTNTTASIENRGITKKLLKM